MASVNKSDNNHVDNRDHSDYPRPLRPPLPVELGATALAGEVRTLQGRPLQGVTFKIGDIEAQSDSSGRFVLRDAPRGRQTLVIDGSMAGQTTSTYGIFEVGVDLVAHIRNTLPYPIWMPEIDTSYAVSISSPTSEAIIVSHPNIPGLELHIPAGAVIRDREGQLVTQISISPVPVDRPPFPLPRSIGEVPIFFTIQPGGAYVSPAGARLIYPNYTNEKSGTRTSFWNYDPTGRGWYIYGKGTVTPDEKSVIPDPGVKIYKFAAAMQESGRNGPPEGPAPGGGGGGGGGGSGPNPNGGDPVDLSTGLFVYQKTDIVLPDVLPVALTRTYRPRDSDSRAFGIGTNHPFEMFLFSQQQYEVVDLILPTGGRVHYVRISPGTGFADAEYEHDKTPSVFYKSRIIWNGHGWDLTLKDGTVYVFGDTAPLNAIRDRYGNTISVLRAELNEFNSPVGNITQIRTPNGRWLAFDYDAENRITQVTDNIGRTVSYEYDVVGRLIRVVDLGGGITEYTYDAENRMETIKDARGIVFLRNEYDPGGKVLKQTLANGGIYQFGYTLDANENITQAMVTDPHGHNRRVTFNTDGYVLSDTEAIGTSEEQTVLFERENGTNLIKSVTDALGRKTAYTYDAMGNIRAITRLADTVDEVNIQLTYIPKFNLLASVVDPLGRTTQFDYDGIGHLNTVTDALGDQLSIAYNAAGQPTTITDPLGNATQFSYDHGDLVSITDALGETFHRYVDEGGRTVRLADSSGVAFRYSYDVFNRLESITDPTNAVTRFEYDANSNLIGVRDANNNETSYLYNETDALSERTDALGRTESYQYDTLGSLTQFTDRKGQTATLDYDSLNRLKRITYADASSITYVYDAGNRIRQVIDTLSGTIQLDYDDMDRLTQIVTSQGTVNYSYDAIGRRQTMVVSGQAPVNYTYDAADRLIEIEQASLTVTIDYDSNGQPTRLGLPGDVTGTFNYDGASQLSSIVYTHAGTVLGDIIYEYDDSGNRMGVTGSLARTSLPDGMSQTLDEANQLITQDTTSLSYDANGNLISDGVRTYTWDARDQLVSISGPGLTANFRYDAFGRRISKTVNGTNTEFLYDDLNVVQELSGGIPIANLLTGLGIDNYFVRIDANGTHSLLVDGRGSTIALVDDSGTITTEYSYTPYGATTASGVDSENPFQYTGRENDATGLYYYRSRYYSPDLRRFISEDPLEFTSSTLNRYSYVENNPINYIDPLGLFADTGTAFDCLNIVIDFRDEAEKMEGQGRKENEEKLKELTIRLSKDWINFVTCLSFSTAGGGGGDNIPEAWVKPQNFRDRIKRLLGKIGDYFEERAKRRSKYRPRPKSHRPLLPPSPRGKGKDKEVKPTIFYDPDE